MTTIFSEDFEEFLEQELPDLASTLRSKIFGRLIQVPDAQRRKASDSYQEITHWNRGIRVL